MPPPIDPHEPRSPVPRIPTRYTAPRVLHSLAEHAPPSTIELMQADDDRRIEHVFDRVRERMAEYKGFVTTPEYLELVARVEALPQNADGADKTGVELAWLNELEHYRKVWRENAP